MLFVSCYLCWRRKSFSLFSIARCVFCVCSEGVMFLHDLCAFLYVAFNYIDQLLFKASLEPKELQNSLKLPHSPKVNCKLMKNEASTEFNSAFHLCCTTCVTKRIRGGKAVTVALWLLASELLFLVSFKFFLWCQAEKKWQEKGAGWVSMSLVLICADLALQDSLTSVTHTSHCRREEGETGKEKTKRSTTVLVWI